jgi:DNA-binding transcriptional MerR regulator
MKPIVTIGSRQMNIDGRLSIGSLAEAAGVKVVTVRYYEKVKLLPEPARSDGNYRAYKLEHLHRLRFIRRCRDLGFTLDQVRDLLRLSVQGKQDCSDVDRIATPKYQRTRSTAGARQLPSRMTGLGQ